MGDISQETVNQFITIMKAGNTIYDIINPPVWQPNLFVEEVINAVNFPFEKQNSLTLQLLQIIKA